MGIIIPWTDAEKAVVREHYGKISQQQLMNMLPGRTSWHSVQNLAGKLGRTGRKFEGPNRYEIRGEVGIIFLERKDGSILECVVSAHRLDELINLGRWCVAYVDGKPYVRCTYPVNLQLHRVITNAPKGLDVDHRDDNGLNNTDNNLRVATRSQNNQNRSPLSKNAASGYRNVGFNKSLGYWVASVSINGKDITKYTKTKEQAIELAAQLRAQYYPFAARG